MRYMPCPSLKELIATVRAIHKLTKGNLEGDDLVKRVALDEHVKARVAVIGPFLREILLEDDDWDRTLKSRSEMFKKLDFSVLGELVAMSLPDHPENHFIHTYMVNRGGERPYSEVTLKLSCDLVIEEANKALAKKDIADLQQLLDRWLKEQNESARLGLQNLVAKRLVLCGGEGGLGWECAQVVFNQLVAW